jgi:acetyl-CoA C-acetyltransferase
MMSRVPMLADQARIFHDPAFGQACRVLLMGSGADLIASRHGITRAEADAVALASQQRAAAAQAAGRFDASILPVETPDTIACRDECLRADTTAESLAALAPAFAELGASGVDAYQLAAVRAWMQSNTSTPPAIRRRWPMPPACSCSVMRRWPRRSVGDRGRGSPPA